MSPDRLATSPLPRQTRRPLHAKVWSAGRWLVLSVALVVTFGTFFMTGMRVANRAREVSVPDLTGMSATRAKQAVINAGLVLQIEARRPDASVPRDQVIDQEPLPGSVLRRQRTVRVRVSDGRQDPVVPAVVGQLERTAELALTDQKITVSGRAEIRSDAFASSAIVGQDPASPQQSSKIALLVNRGQETAGYVMPDVIGALGARAVDVLRRRGFRVSVGAEVPYPGLPAGVVVRQTPQAGFRVAMTDAIVLEVSR